MRKTITLKEAKAISRQLIHRLPRCGYELPVRNELRRETIKTELYGDVRYITGQFRVITWLVNTSGRYHLREYIAPFPEVMEIVDRHSHMWKESE